MNKSEQGVVESPRESISSPALLRMALYYGLAGFGGGYSVLSQLRRDIVDERRWLTADEFIVLAELSKSLPGTPATSLLTLLGQRVGGLRGGLVAGVAFLLPSTILMIGCGAAYSLMRKATSIGLFFDGMNAAMVGVVGATTLDLGRSALKGRKDVIAASVCAGVLVGRIASEPIVAAIAVAIGVAMTARKRSAAPDEPPPSERLHGAGPWFLLGGGYAAWAGLARVFVPIGILTFGGGLAMIPAIEHTVVVEQHWLDPKTFADAVALGQITPGPVAVCATFIGFRVGGLAGALVATIAMFGPAMGLALSVGHSVERFRRSPFVEGALRALAPAVIGMLVAATISLARAGIEGWFDVVVAAASFAFLHRFKRSPLWPLVTGGLAHVAAMHFGLR